MIKKILKSLAVGLISVVLVTIGIDAADHYDNLSQSIAGRVLGEEEGPCPEDMVFVPTEGGGFCIDMYEVSPSEDCPFQNISSQAQTQGNIDDYSCQGVSKSNQEPWRFLSQTQAMTICARAGKRLPSDEEWYLASLGTPDKGSDWSLDDCQVDSNWALQPGLTGAGKNCQSAYGAFDMVGNVWEWVRAEVKDGMLDGEPLPESGFVTSVDSSGMPRSTDPENDDPNYNQDYFWLKEKGYRSVARGGYWDNKSEAGVYAMYMVPPLNFAGTGIGFRCVK